VLGRAEYTPQSAEIYNLDMRALMPVVEKVLAALGCNAPPPGGDGGYQEFLRKESLVALEWAEAWVKYRAKSGWGHMTCPYLDDRVYSKRRSEHEDSTKEGGR